MGQLAGVDPIAVKHPSYLVQSLLCSIRHPWFSDDGDVLGSRGGNTARLSEQHLIRHAGWRVRMKTLGRVDYA